MSLSSALSFLGVFVCSDERFLFSSPPLLGVSSGIAFLGVFVSSDIEVFLLRLSSVMSRKNTEWEPFPQLPAFSAAFRMLAFVSLVSRVMRVICDLSPDVGSSRCAPIMFF